MKTKRELREAQEATTRALTSASAISGNPCVESELLKTKKELRDAREKLALAVAQATAAEKDAAPESSTSADETEIKVRPKLL